MDIETFTELAYKTMANQKPRAKNGMGGSNGGRGRTMGTSDYKKYGKKLRRQISKKLIREYLCLQHP